MKASAILAVSLASIVTSSPAPFPQPPGFCAVDFATTVVDGPQGISNQTEVYPSVSAVSAAAAQVTAVSSNSTGLDKRTLFVLLEKLFGGHKVSPSSSKPATPNVPITTPEIPAITSVQKTPNTTTSFSEACATMPKEGTYSQEAATPKGYENTFKDLNAAVSANSYLGLHNLSSYNVQGCSKYSITNFKCTLWGSGVEKDAATNTGQVRRGFEVVIVGSNSYEKTSTTTPAPCPGYKPPKPCKGAAINRPSCAIGSHFFPGPFNPAVCASYASAQNAMNKKNVAKGQKFLPCNMFNAYMMKRNGKAMGTYCLLYTQAVDVSYANYFVGSSGNHRFSVESS
ncbi:hypothetical protein B0J11DRAFT_588371 [Dendryphion nanum]|uniref:Uncharacterized protein n=1 Tax=Dendryphion nanum TaxID=256645 RepID=A0A9P9J1K6_9PLEO|nr:hypothetical protein B0J11DRAFT_588371 [Dendryphion nanum]